MGSLARRMSTASLHVGLFLLVVTMLHGNTESAEMTAAATERIRVMDSLGLKSSQEDVEKALWEAQQAEDDVKAEDDELARLMAEMDQLDTEKDAALASAKKKDLEAKQKQSAQLKAVAAQKAAEAEAAIKRKAQEVEAVSSAAQKEAEDMIEKTKSLRSKAAAAMEEAKLASAEYQSALSSGQTEGLASLKQTAKQALAQAETLSKTAGEKSKLAKKALENASQVKAKAEKATEMESESVQQLEESRLTWAAGPIFDKMKRLCDLDYPAFRKEYHKLRESPAFAKYRWDIKKACHKAHDDDLEAVTAKDNEENQNPVGAHVDESQPYPDKNRHWNMPKDKNVKKWCSTKFGAVPCSMLKKAQEAGLLGESSIMLDTESLIQDDAGVSRLDTAPELGDIVAFEDA